MISLSELADRYVEESARLDPCQATLMGVVGHEGKLTDYSPEGFGARTELARRTLAELRSVPVGTDPDRVAAAVLRERLEIDLDLAEAGVPDADLNVLDGPLQRLCRAMNVLDHGSLASWEARHACLRAFPKALRGLRDTLVRARQDGRVAARRQVGMCARQCSRVLPYLSGLPQRYGDGPLRRDLDQAVRAASAALDEFGRFLVEELAPAAPDRDGLGRDRYALEVRNALGTRLDLEEVYSWGWAELARIETEMRETAAAIMPGEPLPAVIAALDADPAHRLAGVQAFLAWIQELADRTIAELDGVHFEIPEPLRRIACRIPAADDGVYYLAPSEDLARPGTVWWSVTEPATEIVTWSVPATIFHEGVPGHHLQRGTTVLNTVALNRFQRLSGASHQGHSEGWALYAERLMGELGYYADPAHHLGMLAGGQQLRAARVVLDIGMHLHLPIPRGTGFHEGERWTRALGVEFLRRHCGPEDDDFVTFEIDRYLGRPAQAIAYKIGERVWLETREAARRRLGAAFDLRAFHRKALDLGPMGLDLLRVELTRQ
jgi:uncharacterized protein (DUF885 family)